MKRGNKNWSATESTDFAGAHRKLVVVGEVETHSGDEVVSLAEATPQGFEASTLLLDLTVTRGELGTAVMGWAQVSFTKPVERHQYRSVEIRGEEIHQQIPVVEEIS